MKTFSQEKEYLIISIDIKHPDLARVSGQNPCVLCKDYLQKCDGCDNNHNSTCLVPCG